MRRSHHPRGDRRAASRTAALLGHIAAITLFLVGPVRADWLVTEDGRRIETQGSWEERGELLVFHLADGTLASMRKSKVDLEESARVTQAAMEQDKQPAEAPPSAPEKAVFVLTDADVGHVRDRGPIDPPVEGEQVSETAPPQNPVEVSGWRSADLDSGDGMVITGTARNLSQNTVAGLSLEVVILDVDGDVQATAPATLGATVLAPGQSCTLTADLIGVFDITAVRFNFDFTPVRTDSAPAAAQSTQRPDEEG